MRSKGIFSTSHTQYERAPLKQFHASGVRAIRLDAAGFAIRKFGYRIARALQFFSPGIPQVYYVGLLAGANDIELL